MKKLLLAIAILGPMTSFAGQSVDYFSACNSGDNLTPVQNLNSVRLLSTNTFKGCPMQVVYRVQSSEKILPLVSVREGVSGGEYSARYEDIKPFISCAYENTRAYIGCSLRDELVSEDVLSEQALINLENQRRAWQRRNQ
jgi:hypothetical protein